MACLAEAFTHQITYKRLNIFSQQLHGPPMVPPRMVGCTEEVLCHDLQGDIAEGLSHGQGVLTGLHCTVVIPDLPE